MKLYYHTPATQWTEVLPVGNGRLGGMIWGTVTEEKIGLNDIAVWSGIPGEERHSDAVSQLEKVRSLIFAEQYKKAELLIEDCMLGPFSESYLPVGDLLIGMAHGEADPGSYRRTLDIETAVASVTYTVDGTAYDRKVFVSRPDGVMAVRLTCEKPMGTVTVSLDSQLIKENVTFENACMHHALRCPEHVDPNYLHTDDPIVWGEKGIRFPVDVTVADTDGEVAYADGKLTVTGATVIFLTLSAVVTPEETPIYPVMLSRHIADYQKRFRRVELDLGEQPDLPTDERLERLRAGGEDNALYALYFQFGRYLLISCSDENSPLPPNLQGIWCWQMRAPWSSNYTVNINTEMNVWPALSCAVPEVMPSYLRLVKKMAETGKVTAKEYFGCRGFCAAHNVDAWGITNPVGLERGQDKGQRGSANWSMWTGGAAWMCQELWRLYEYNPDVDYLREELRPILREAALFYCDFLVEKDGYLVTCPSTSPENRFIDPNNGESRGISMASTMDMTLIREVFRHYLSACEALGEDDEICAMIREKMPKLWPYQIGKHGQLQEWYRDFDEYELGHRHVSHLYGLFPGEEFVGNAELTEACRVSLQRRIENGGGHTGWSCAWLINLYAVLQDREKADFYLRTLLTRSTLPNLWDNHPPFQIDGNFGGSAGIANLLVQDRGGEIKLLPCLPEGWKNGSVKGLRIKGSKAVDITWENGILTDSRIYDIEY